MVPRTNTTSQRIVQIHICKWWQPERSLSPEKKYQKVVYGLACAKSDKANLFCNCHPCARVIYPMHGKLSILVEYFLFASMCGTLFWRKKKIFFPARLRSENCRQFRVKHGLEVWTGMSPYVSAFGWVYPIYSSIKTKDLSHRSILILVTIVITNLSIWLNWAEWQHSR